MSVDRAKFHKSVLKKYIFLESTCHETCSPEFLQRGVSGLDLAILRCEDLKNNIYFFCFSIDHISAIKAYQERMMHGSQSH